MDYLHAGEFTSESLQCRRTNRRDKSGERVAAPARYFEADGRSKLLPAGDERQKPGADCRNSKPASIWPLSLRIRRATRQVRSWSVCRLVRIKFWDRTTLAEIGTNPPQALTLMVSVFSEKGSPWSLPYTCTGRNIGKRWARR